MGIAEDIEDHASTTFKSRWDTRGGQKVPEPNDLRLSNEAVHFGRVTVLYADLDQSTSLVEAYKWFFAGEIYKTYLYAASRLINDMGGSIVSYDGDRVMAVFLGDSQSNDAVRCAMKINYAVKQLVQVALKKQYPDSTYTIRHVVGIDTSEMRVARTGVRGDNDLVWIGNSANLAAKLTAKSAAYATWITDRVYDLLNEPQRISSGKNMWTRWAWNKHQDDTIYSSSYWWKF